MWKRKQLKKKKEEMFKIKKKSIESPKVAKGCDRLQATWTYGSKVIKRFSYKETSTQMLSLGSCINLLSLIIYSN